MLIAGVACLALSAAAHAAEKSCAPQGDSPQARLQALDVLKNRMTLEPMQADVTLAQILAGGPDDRARWDSQHSVSIVGYITLVKAGGAETANCHSAVHRDVHIEIAAEPLQTGVDAMVVEITPALQAQLGGLKAMRALKGQLVVVTGDLFLDEEHLAAAVNSGCRAHCWRRTAWEIHPVLQIKPAVQP